MPFPCLLSLLSSASCVPSPTLHLFSVMKFEIQERTKNKRSPQPRREKTGKITLILTSFLRAHFKHQEAAVTVEEACALLMGSYSRAALCSPSRGNIGKDPEVYRPSSLPPAVQVSADACECCTRPPEQLRPAS